MSGISTNRTNITLPTQIAAEILQKTQDQSAVMRLARRITLPGNGLTIPMITGDPEAAWVDETDKKPVSNPTLSQKVMKGYTLAVIVPFSNQFRRDLPSLYGALVERLPLALAGKFDATVFNGPAPGTGFDTFAAITAESVDAAGENGGIYGALVAADGDIAAAGGILNGFALSPQAKSIMLSAEDSTHRPLFINNVSEGAIPMLLGAPAYYSKGIYGAGNAASGTSGSSGYVPAKADMLGVAGDWTQAMYGVVEGVNIDLSDQATLSINDSAVNLWERNMFAVRAEIEIGFCADTDCFVKLTRTHSA